MISNLCLGISLLKENASTVQLSVRNLYQISTTFTNYQLDIANAVCNSVSDLLILALPIPVVWNLALTRRKKITLSLVFAMGSAGCIVSIIRLRSIIAYLQQGNGDLTFTILDFVVWSAIETMMSMVSQ
jgi:hypothetical protein